MCLQKHPTIQAAIASATDGDTVLVAPGTYYEQVILLSKALSLVSEAGPDLTILDGSLSGTVILCRSQAVSNSVIAGFTIRNGAASSGGMYCLDLMRTSLTITSNIFEENLQRGGGFGAAIGGNNASPILVRNIFRRNSADDQHLSGVVSFVNSSSPLIANNIFVDNACRAINMTVVEGSRPVVINNTIVGNTRGIRVNAAIGVSAHLYANNIIFSNLIGLDVRFSYNENYPVWIHNLVSGNVFNYSGIPDQTGINQNISADPFFACALDHDFNLRPGSPAIDGGNNSVMTGIATDFAGNPRILDGDGDMLASVDIGALEFNPVALQIPCVYALCPTNVVAYTRRGETSAVVSYPSPSGPQGADVTCSPPTGSSFPAGTNMVTCTAVLGEVADSCTFSVIVVVPPENDDFDFAEEILSLPYTEVENIRRASASADDPVCGSPGKSLWYRFTAPEDMKVFLGGHYGGASVFISVFTGERGDLFRLGCGSSFFNFSAETGETYYIMVVLAHDERENNLRLEIRGAPLLKVRIKIDPVGTVDMRTGKATIGGTITASERTYLGFVSTLRQVSSARSVIKRTSFVYDFSRGHSPGNFRWKADFPSQRRYVPGPARVVINFSTYHHATGEDISIAEARTILLQEVPRPDQASAEQRRLFDSLKRSWRYQLR